MIATQDHDYMAGIRIIRDVLDEIENFDEVDAEEFFTEKRRSVESLTELLEELDKRRPLTESERLQRELHDAIDSEEFERAAELRDRINGLET